MRGGAGEGVWARTYYRNTTGAPLDAALSLLGPDGHSVRSRCVAGAGDDPSLCETPRVRLKGEPLRYTAVAEFAPTRAVRRRGGCCCGPGATPRRERTGEAREGCADPRGSRVPETRNGRCRRPVSRARGGHVKTRLLATGDAPATGLLER
ncbi:hypothetical protein ACFQV4_02810 [Streptomyces thermocarboxydus]